MKRHEFHLEAEVEMNAQADFYESRERGLGIRFLLAADAAINRLKFDPQARPTLTLELRRQPVKRFPFHVLYLDEPDRIWIVAIAHYRWRDDYWLNRP